MCAILFGKAAFVLVEAKKFDQRKAMKFDISSASRA